MSSKLGRYNFSNYDFIIIFVNCLKASVVSFAVETLSFALKKIKQKLNHFIRSIVIQQKKLHFQHTLREVLACEIQKVFKTYL